jgi:CheY-like chemotaxis protein
MPVMDGMTACKLLREEHNCKIPIIALTTAVLKSEHDEYLAAGLDELLPKPIDFEELRKLLTELTGQRVRVA